MLISTAKMETGVERFPFHRVPGNLVLWNEVPCLVLAYCSMERSTRNLRVLELDAEFPQEKHTQWVGEKKVSLLTSEQLISKPVREGIKILRGMPCRINRNETIGIVQKMKFQRGQWVARIYHPETEPEQLSLLEITLLGLPNLFMS